MSSGGAGSLGAEDVGGEDDAEDDGKGNLDGGETGGEGGFHLGGNHEIGAPEDASTRNQGEDAAN